jgi:hypothetical protein
MAGEVVGGGLCELTEHQAGEFLCGGRQDHRESGTVAKIVVAALAVINSVFPHRGNLSLERSELVH